ncbi:hypothetical protein COCSUDRAFT_66998 [Coccomyxa subellipsoidea C-169]|uniref:Microtubule associated protein n=1 Tax=Coccomyxa subellipsoidea (strain C-169) TaxID=574566 RepID=I0YTE1_COCSC|nr:hypothetical protein COCSUDRAFT_66998 [Coccomyxa subellipsoidea C-169]EIE21660.1 hypothetical protein COCSUDRAFT_66998 [Coccomyxa subellipsoidea C-169]|eukprot:XP_005646204.1 hypothetical protein COCSUDRAFT_66998 [Coccomyxa subellipsoidea C-169]
MEALTLLSNSGSDWLQELVEGTLMKQYRIIKEELALWRDKKSQRMEEIEALQAKIGQLHARIGRSMHARSFQDLTSTELERLGIEITRLQDECQKRQQTLESTLSNLRRQSDELGEDAWALAAEAHPTLLRLVEGDGQSTAGDELDVSDKTLKHLDQKAEKLRKLKAERKEQAVNLLSVLEGLWDVLETAEDDVDRKKFQALLDGPLRVHNTTLDKVKAEVEHLEGRKAELIRKMIDVKRRELEDICTESHMSLPPLPHSEAAPDSHTAASAQVAEVLAKVVKQVGDAEAEAERRSRILDAIEDLRSMRAECSWLIEYDRDDSRYKGRDANRKLQRAIKAGKARDRMPAVIEQMQSMLEAWAESEDRPFLYDERDYQEVLAELMHEVQAEAQQRAAAHHQKTQGNRKAAAAVGTPGKPGGLRTGSIRPSTPRSDKALTPLTSSAGSEVQHQRRTPKLLTPRAETLPGCSKDGQLPARKTARNASISVATEEKMNKLLKSCAATPPSNAKKTPVSAAAKAQPLTDSGNLSRVHAQVRVQGDQLMPALSSPSRLASPFSVAAAADKWKQSPEILIPKLPTESLQRTRSF